MRKRAHDTSGRKGTAAGREIIGGLTELVEALERGEPEAARLTVKTVQLPDDPRTYDAAAVRATWARLGASQAVFARLMGVSLKLAQAWEQGAREPSRLARRLLDAINRDPAAWASVLRPGRAGAAPSSRAPRPRARAS